VANAKILLDIAGLVFTLSVGRLNSSPVEATQSLSNLGQTIFDMEKQEVI